MLLIGRRGIDRCEDDGVVDEGTQAESARIGRPSRDGEIASIHMLASDLQNVPETYPAFV